MRLILADDIKEEVVKQVRNCAPSAIDLIVDVSKHIDINNIKVDSKGIADFITKKLLCCIFHKNKYKHLKNKLFLK